MEIFKMIRGFIFKSSRSFKNMQNVVFYDEPQSKTLSHSVLEV